MLKQESQKDISKYFYCKEFGISPYPGSYGEQPSRWIQKTSIINRATNIREDREIKKIKRDAQMRNAKNV